jgi:nucleoid DNA-binding protein
VNIAVIIRDLLLRNEQVVIPGFGTFRVIRRPAEISKNTQLLLPPSKAVVFDNQQKIGDNQLLLSVRKKLGLSESETGEALKKYLHSLEQEIRKSGSVMIEGLGQLSKDKSGKLKFEPLDKLMNLTGLFALPKLEIPVPGTMQKDKPAPSGSGTTSMPVPRKRKRWWIAAAVLVLMASLVSLAYFTGVFSGEAGVAASGKKAAHEKNYPKRIIFGNHEPAKSDSTREAISRQLEERTSRENALRFEENRQKQAADSALRATASLQKVEKAGPYYIISGSFLESRNAEKQQSLLTDKGLHPELLPHTGKYYMVSLGSFATREEAKTASEQLRKNLGLDLWVMKITRP